MASTSKKLTINAISAIVQVAFTAILYFFLYKYLLNHLGVKLLGVWSLILSFSSIANLANLGITSGLVKFVADYIAENKQEKIGKLIMTSTLTLLALFSITSLIILFGADYFLHFVINEKFLNIALSILPLSLGSFCINALSGIFTSVLEGYQKNYIRNLIYIVSGIIMFIGTIWLAPKFSLMGVAAAQFIQALFIFISSIILVLRINPFNRLRYWKWSTRSLKELFTYGYKFSAVSICQLLYEPTTKLLLSKFGGLTLLGHYEMANKMVSQFRSLLVSANQVVIPVIAETVKTKTTTYLQEFYITMCRMLLLITFPLSTLLVLLTPLISIVWIGYNEPDFDFAVYVLTIGYIVNIMSSPAFFSCMGEGRLNIPLVSHVSMAAVNFLLGCFLGWLWGGHGIVLAWGIALVLGSMVTILVYQNKIRLKIRQILSQNDRMLIYISSIIIVIGICLFSLKLFWVNDYIKSIILNTAYIVLIIIIASKNKLVKDLSVYFNHRKR